MSPDDIFAAQFWPWPDPAIKRDAQGRVLFVNAAFLGLYGGRVEDWRGNAVGGWPAPQAASATPNRFETRLPGHDGTEQVYDWMEQTLADGNAFALARNVTVFTQAPDPTPTEHIDPSSFVNAQAPETQLAQSAPEGAYAHEASEPTMQAQDFHPPASQDEAPAAQSWDAPAAQEVDPAPHIELPQIDIPQIDIPSDDAYAMSNDAPAAHAPQYASETQQPAQEQQREFERRALPIEDDSAVLGNNWRDAVIAKAVGAADVAPQAGAPVSDETPAPSAVQAAQGQSGPIRILLAEDNAINALLTRTLLEAEGHTVDTVEDGQLAVEAMKTASYDLIFMDMRMPNMDGLEATRKIRTLPNVSKALPIIALTANAFDDDRNACFDSGMNDFMTKPVSAEELSEKVKDWTSAEAKARMMNAA